MTFLYATSIGYGIGTGVGVDLMLKVKDPALALIAPVAIGAAVPVGIYFLDREVPFHRGVPSATGVGVMLGAFGGGLISTTQYSLASKGNSWPVSTYAAITVLSATGGGIGGYAFGEWLRPRPQNLGFIASGAGWGMLTGGLLAGGVSGSGSGDAWKAASVGGLVGYGAGTVLAGALSTVYHPSFNTQKYQWLGYGVGVGATSVIYAAYLFVDGDPKRGMVANAIGGVAGLALASLFAAELKDDERAEREWTPPFQLGFQPVEKGGVLQAFGQF